MGSHLLFKDLRRMGRSISFVLIFEAVGTSVLVTAGIYLFIQNLPTALIFGAIAFATAPAATVNVLAEYDAHGPLTTSLLAVVGLDDALSLLLYSLAAAFAVSSMGGFSTTIASQFLILPLIEIGGSVGLGLLLGQFLDFIMSRVKRHHDAMAISIAFVFLAVGLSESLGFSFILTTMVLGVVVVNRFPEHDRHIRFTIEQAGPVIYVLFFALVGARLQISLLPTMGLMGIAYVVLRSLGKFTSAWIGGWFGRAEPVVRDNLGYGLLSDAEVAIELDLASAGRFSHLGEERKVLGSLIINVVTATTFIVQIVGPIFVKVAISRAGEIGQAKLGDGAWASKGTPE
ncbi:MAG: cation:proton antiporter [Chloroflexota bacterium]